MRSEQFDRVVRGIAAGEGWSASRRTLFRAMGLGGAAVGAPGDLVPESQRVSFPVASFAELAGHGDGDDVVVLDVRRDDDFDEAVRLGLTVRSEENAS